MVKTFRLLLIFSLITYCLLPKTATGDPRIMELVESRAELSGGLPRSAAPFEILGSMLRDRFTRSLPGTPAPDASDERETAPVDYSLSGAGGGFTSAQSACGAGSVQTGASWLSAPVLPYGQDGQPRHGPPPGAFILLTVLLAFFFLRPRSAIDDALFLIRPISIARLIQAGFFIVYGASARY